MSTIKTASIEYRKLEYPGTLSLYPLNAKL